MMGSPSLQRAQNSTVASVTLDSSEPVSAALLLLLPPPLLPAVSPPPAATGTASGSIKSPAVGVKSQLLLLALRRQTSRSCTGRTFHQSGACSKRSQTLQATHNSPTNFPENTSRMSLIADFLNGTL
jgi:hypothetical protein